MPGRTHAPRLLVSHQPHSLPSLSLCQWTVHAANGEDIAGPGSLNRYMKVRARSCTRKQIHTRECKNPAPDWRKIQKYRLQVPCFARDPQDPTAANPPRFAVAGTYASMPDRCGLTRLEESQLRGGPLTSRHGNPHFRYGRFDAPGRVAVERGSTHFQARQPPFQVRTV